MIRKLSFSLLIFVVTSALALAQDPIPVAEIKRADPVDFDKEILPILRQNCLACHNSTDAEGDVVLESVPKILESEAAIPGKPGESSLLQLSAHLDDPVMPPEDNEVKAQNLTSQQLGLVKLWISQGAKPSAISTANKVTFAKLPAGINPVYAMAMSDDGQFLAAGRANQIFVYRVPSKQLVDRVTDPALLKSGPYDKPGIAHLDIVQSLVFSPNNQTFVSGGFRTVKIWNRVGAQKSTFQLNLPSPPTALSTAGGNLYAFGDSKGTVSVVDLNSRKTLSTIPTGDKAIDAVGIQADGKRVAVVTEKRKLRIYDVAQKKPVGSEVTLEADAVSLAFASSDQQLLTGLSNNVINAYSLDKITAPVKPAAPEKPADPKGKAKQAKQESPKQPAPIAPEKKLAGHSKPPVHLRLFGENRSKLITAADDGTAKTWDLAAGRQIRSFSHSAPICGLEISSDGSLVATCGTNGSVKIFNATNSSLIKEVKGDVNIEFQTAEHTRNIKLKQQLIDVAKRDLDAANKEKTAEEANVKKVEEALKKADEELKKKLAAKTKADTDFNKANQPFVAKKAELVPLAKQLSDLDAQIKAETEKQTKLNNESKVVDAALAKATTAQAQTAKALTDATAKAAKDAKNEALKKAVETATQTNTKAVDVLATAKAAKEKHDAAKNALAAMLKTLNAQKAELAKKIAAVNAEIKKMEPNIKKLTDAQKKATDEHTAAQRNQTLAKNSVDRAKVRAKNVADKIPGLDQKHKQAVAEKAAAEKQAQEFKAANEKKLTALVGLAQLADGSLVYRDADGRIGRCDFRTGEKLDSLSAPEMAKSSTLMSRGNELLAISADGKTGSVLSLNDGWQLTKTIGHIDDPKIFVDRVTALDISSDGKLLATGSGEPSRSGEIKVWDLATGTLVKEIKDAHSDTILDLKFSPDGTRIASGSSDRFMKTFDLNTGKMIRVFEGHTHHVMSVDWNSTGRELSSAGADKVVKVWDAETGTQKRTISGYGKEVTALSFVELTNNIITTSGDKTVRLKRTDNGGEVRRFAGNADFVYTVATTADGKKFAAGGEDSVVRVWTDNGQVFVEFPAPKE